MWKVRFLCSHWSCVDGEKSGDAAGPHDALFSQSNAAAIDKGIPVDSLLINGQYLPLEPQFENSLMSGYYNQLDILRRMVCSAS